MRWLRRVLYDNQKDPYQLTNLLGQPEHAELAEQLERRMRELMAEAHDPGDSDKVAEYIASMRPKE